MTHFLTTHPLICKHCPLITGGCVVGVGVSSHNTPSHYTPPSHSSTLLCKHCLVTTGGRVVGVGVIGGTAGAAMRLFQHSGKQLVIVASHHSTVPYHSTHPLILSYYPTVSTLSVLLIPRSHLPHTSHSSPHCSPPCSSPYPGGYIVDRYGVQRCVRVLRHRLRPQSLATVLPHHAEG